MQKQELIKSIPSAVSVKNARLFFDNKRSSFRLIHYNDEILTVKVIEPITGEGQTDLDVINIFPVSASSINAINQALNHLGIRESIDSICDKLDIDYRKLSFDFWGFDPHHKTMHYDPNRISTFSIDKGSKEKRKKSQWDDIAKDLENIDLPTARSNLKYYLLEGFDGNDILFKKVVKSSTYEALEIYIKKMFNSYGIRKFEDIGSDPPGYIATYKNGETRLAITVYDMEFKNNEDKLSQVQYYRSYYNGSVTLDFKEKYLANSENMQPHHNEIVTMGDKQFNASVFLMKQSDIGKCPHFILTPEHYRNNGSCKCDDPNDPNMKEWGYTWNNSSKKWEGSE